VTRHGKSDIMSPHHAIATPGPPATRRVRYVGQPHTRTLRTLALCIWLASSYDMRHGHVLCMDTAGPFYACTNPTKLAAIQH